MINHKKHIRYEKSFSVVTLTNEAGNISLAENLNVELNILEFIMANSKGVVNKLRLDIKHRIMLRIISFD